MFACNQVRFFLTTVLIAAVCTTAGAQTWQPFGGIDFTHDFQPFAPFEIRNFTDQPGPREGYFFAMDKLSWAIPGERNVVGNPNATAFSIDNFPGSPDGPTPITNGLLSTAPDAQFRWGERYEFGNTVGHHGWLVSVLDGPKTNEQTTYGLVGGVAPLAPPVAILFTAPEGLMDGFQGAIPAPLNYNLLVTFLASFDTVAVNNYTELDGVELMKTYRFNPTQRNSIIEFYYGARYFRLRDHFRVDTTGGTSTLGASFWDTVIYNHIVGPQVGLKWYHQRGRWTINTQGRFTFGYNIQNQDQNGLVGQNLNPGVADVPMYFYPTAFTHSLRDDDFSPLVEMRVEASYQLTKAVALKLGWTGTFVDNIRRAATQVNYTLPSMGFVDNGTQDIFVNGAHAGFEINR